MSITESLKDEHDACLLVFHFGEKIFSRLKKADVSVYDIHLENHIHAPKKVSLRFKANYKATNFRFELISKDWPGSDRLKLTRLNESEYIEGRSDEEVEDLLEFIESKTPCYWPTP